VGWINGRGSERANKRRGRAERAEEGDKGPEMNLASSSIQKCWRCVVAYVLCGGGRDGRKTGKVGGGGGDTSSGDSAQSRCETDTAATSISDGGVSINER
jgi:hypothetical protein